MHVTINQREEAVWLLLLNYFQMKNLLLTLAAIIFIVSCNNMTKKQNLNQNDVKIITVKEKDIQTNLNFSDVVELDSLVYLELTNESLIGDIGKVKVSDDRIYIHDIVTGSLFCFDRSGSFINSFNKFGRGPDEYTSLEDFSIFNNKVYALVRPARLLVLDNNLNLIKSIDIKSSDADPLVRLEVTNKDTAIFSAFDSPHKYFFFNIKDEEYISYHFPALGPGVHFRDSPFTKSPSNQIFLTERYNDTVFSIRRDEILPVYFVDFEKPISERERLEQINIHRWDVSNDKRNTVQDMYNMSAFRECDQFIAFTFIYHRRQHFYYKNRTNARVIIFPNNITDDILGTRFIRKPVGFHGSSNIKIVHSNELISTGKHSIPDDLCPDSSNPILAFFHVKFIE